MPLLIWLIYLKIKGCFFQDSNYSPAIQRGSMISIPRVWIKSTRVPWSHDFFKLLAFLVIAFTCTTTFKQNFHSFIPSLCKVLNYHLSCGWNVSLLTGKVTILIYDLFAGLFSHPLPLFNLSLCMAGDLHSSMVWLTLTSRFVLLCHVLASEKPSERITTALFWSGNNTGFRTINTDTDTTSNTN